MRLAVLVLLLLVVPVKADTLSGSAVIELAHEAAGGQTWVRPKTLYMRGASTFYENNKAVVAERHEMWRVYAPAKSSAHQADGKVRIRSERQGKVVFDVAFDGVYTYAGGKRTEEPADSNRWASNFGFGVIRHALDEGYKVERLADDWIDGHRTYTVTVIDPEKRETLFAIDKQNHAVRMVGFSTPRGWHHRVYSDFFSKPGVSWQQPGLVRLYYDGVKQNEVRWQEFQVNNPLADELFQLTRDEAAP